MGRLHIAELFLVVLFFIESTQLCFCKNTSFGCFEREGQALLQFKKSFIKDPLHRLSSWEGTDCCKWQGVNCSTSTGHVVKLDLRTYDNYDNQSVAKEINPSLLELKYLNYLDLTGIDFQGSTIPKFLGLMIHLKYLNLDGAYFTGRVPRQLGNLTNLRVLDLHADGGGAIRGGGVIREVLRGLNVDDLNWVSRLKSLRYLDMSGIDLSGAHNLMQVLNMLPSLLELRLSTCRLDNSHLLQPFVNSTFLSATQHLDLSLNLFSKRPLPIFLQNMTSVRVLNLRFNSFNSSIPVWLVHLKRLEILDFSFNSLNGPIPASIGRLSNLRELDLSNNQLNGSIPESLGQLLNLKTLHLASNSLEGVLSEIHFSNFSKLEDFDISFNDLSFNVKPEWAPPFQLNYIDMNSCKFQNQFPQWLETQKKVEMLDLANASISGPLPNWLWFMNISYLDLSHNHITGPLPHNIGDTMPTLGYLQLDDNLINGTIPSSFCKIDSLSELDLSNNMVFGEIPNCWSDSNQLVLLKISSNRLTGVIPNSIGSLSGLEWLHLNNNSLHGEVPLSLRNCTYLKVLNLGENRFSGNIPTWIGESLSSLQILRLRNNMFKSCIPLQLCQLTSLQILDFAVNNLSGTIPQCFGNFRGMVSQQTAEWYDGRWGEEKLEVVIKGRDYEYTKEVRLLANMDLSDNNLVSTIPEGLTVLSRLNGLNLSHNYFTGNIPKNIGNLTSLESLDFSANKLFGNIPTSMSDLTSLSHLNLSYNFFSGKIPTGPQLQTLVDPSIYAGNLELCGAPLLKRCPGDEPPQAPIPNKQEENDKEDKSEEVWFYTLPVLGYITGLWGVLGVLLFKKSWRYAYFQLADNVIDWIYVKVAINSAWLKKKMAKNHVAD